MNSFGGEPLAAPAHPPSDRLILPAPLPSGPRCGAGRLEGPLGVTAAAP